MYIALRMLLQIDHQRVDMTHRRSCIAVQFLVAHQQAEGTFVAIEFSRHLLHILQRIVHLGHRHGEVDIAEVLGQGVSIVEHMVGLLNHAGHLGLQTCRQVLQLVGRYRQVGGNLVYVLQ